MQGEVGVSVSMENFQTEVVDASAAKPMFLLFWAAQVPPSVQVKESLERLLPAYDGKSGLALSDVAQDQNLAQRLQVQGLPSIRVIHQGQIVDQLEGPVDDAQLTALIEKLTASSGDLLKGDVESLLAAGEFDGALALLQQSIQDEPNNQSLRVELADVLVRKGDDAEARRVLATIAEDTEDRLRPQTRLEFLEEAGAMDSRDTLLGRLAAEPENLEARYALAVQSVVAEAYEDALTAGLDIMGQDRSFMDDIGRTTMIRVFHLLGKGHELATKYRRKMFNLMH